MFRLTTAADLLTAFRPKDRATVELPSASYPLFVRDYLAWTHPSGGWVYLVFAVPGGVPTGVAFQTNGGPGASVPQLCEWCHLPGLGHSVALLTATVNRDKRAGVCVCADLSCRAKVEDEATRAGRSPLPALQRLVGTMGRFASEALGIDLTGAGR